jgi:hypothetical protein
MQVPVIKKIVADYELEQLQAAEDALLEEQAPSIEIEGEDEGEQLTHVIAAIWVKKYMEKEGVPLGKAVREYTVRVRNSIS